MARARATPSATFGSSNTATPAIGNKPPAFIGWGLFLFMRDLAMGVLPAKGASRASSLALLCRRGKAPVLRIVDEVRWSFIDCTKRSVCNNPRRAGQHMARPSTLYRHLAAETYLITRKKPARLGVLSPTRLL